MDYIVSSINWNAVAQTLALGIPVFTTIWMVLHFKHKRYAVDAANARDEERHQKVLGELGQLQERLQSVETIVTSKGYDLSEEINKLSRS